MRNQQALQNWNHTEPAKHHAAEMNKPADALADASELLAKALAVIHDLDLGRSQTPLSVENGVNFYDVVRNFEIDLIRSALRHTKGCQSRAAALLELNTTTLNAKIKAYNINWRYPFQDRGTEGD
jgi:DNA-binding protein Fis